MAGQTMRMARRTAMAAGMALLLAASGAPGAQAFDMTGAGATFPDPVYAKWAEAYKAQTGNGMNYQSIGSGGGIKQIKSKTVDFGASDMPLAIVKHIVNRHRGALSIDSSPGQGSVFTVFLPVAPAAAMAKANPAAAGRQRA